MTPIQKNSSWSNGSGYIDPTYYAAMHPERKEPPRNEAVNQAEIERFKGKIYQMTLSELNSLAKQLRESITSENRTETIDTIVVKRKLVGNRIRTIHQDIAVRKIIDSPNNMENLSFKAIKAERDIWRGLAMKNASESEIKACEEKILFSRKELLEDENL